MYAPKEQKEFYESVEQRKKEIQDFDIADNKKEPLYNLVNETILRFETNKVSYLNKQIALIHLEEEEKRLKEGLKNLKTTLKIASFSVENITEISSHPRYKASPIGKRVLH